jgi:hypothetical protein
MDSISFSHVRHYRKICNGYMAAGARGISVIFSSGDNGVHARDDPSSCSNNTFVVQFPASCPYGVCTSAHVAQCSPLTLNAVTTVGSSQGFPETAAPFSAGGFSNTFDRPAYQDIAVTEFLSTIPPEFPGVFQRAGRAYPDVAMQGVNYQAFDGGNLTHGSGTSASAPAFASLIALLNARLVADGHTPLGFLNRGSCHMCASECVGAGVDQSRSVHLRRGRPCGRVQRRDRREQHGRRSAGLQRCEHDRVQRRDGLGCYHWSAHSWERERGVDVSPTGWGTADFVRLLKAANQGSSNGSAVSPGAEAEDDA